VGYPVVVTRPELIRSFTDAALSPDPELASAALMIARVEYADVDAARYLAELDFIGVEARRRLSLVAQSADTPPGVDAGIHAKVLALNELLFDEIGFAGNETDYEDPRNSFLNEVLDRRTGIPITLSLVYIEVARRAGLAVEGINYPGHFLVRCRTPRTLPHTEDLVIDPFHRGTVLSRERLARQPGGTRLPRATKPQILTRMLVNLKRVYVRMQSIPQARDVADLLIAVDPSAIHELRDRGLMAYQMNDFAAALRDLQAYLQLIPSGEQDDEARQDRERIWEHVKTLRAKVASLN
jgi:regulator of sirC expression with transglutaminase-like and TPR domain